MHSTYSDGLETPRILCEKAIKLNLGMIALCDHDTVNGLSEMASCLSEGPFITQGQIRWIPAAELSTGTDGKIHIIGYGDAILGNEASVLLAKISGNKQERVKSILQSLESLGIFLPDDEINALLQNPNTNRAHIARALIRNGVVHTVKQAFDRYLGVGKPAYVPRETLPATEVTERLREIGVIPVLAHPLKLGMDDDALKAMICMLQDHGLMGVEVFHPSANSGNARRLYAMARAANLTITGGSDYHGDDGDRIARYPGDWVTVFEDTNRLYEMARNM